MEKETKIKVPLSKVANGHFVPALNKLMNMALPNIRDTYALMRTLDQLEPELKTHAKVINQLIEKHGGTATAQGFEITDKSPGWKSFLEERTSLEATSVTLFLDHKVKLPEKNGILSVLDLRELIDLVEC